VAHDLMPVAISIDRRLDPLHSARADRARSRFLAPARGTRAPRPHDAV